MDMDVVVCVSEATQRDVIRLTGIDPARTRVIHNPRSPDFRPPQEPARADVEPGEATGCRRRGRCSHVGGEKSYKNRPAAIRIFAEAARTFGGRAHLLMVGPDTPALRAVAAEHGVADRITFRAHVDEAQLQTAYHAGGVMVFPSLYEGFGWPILEAQASGCAVVCSDASSPPGSGGAGARVLPVGDEQAMAAAVVELWSDQATTQALIARGFENRRFEWEGFQAAWAGLLDEFLQQSSKRPRSPRALRRSGAPGGRAGRSPGRAGGRRGGHQVERDGAISQSGSTASRPSARSRQTMNSGSSARPSPASNAGPRASPLFARSRPRMAHGVVAFLRVRNRQTSGEAALV